MSLYIKIELNTQKLKLLKRIKIEFEKIDNFVITNIATSSE